MEYKITDSVRQRLFGLAIPAGGGLTALAERLRDVDLIDKTGKSGAAGLTYRLVDEEWALKQIENVEQYLGDPDTRARLLYPALRKLLAQILEDNPTEAIIFGTHDPDFLTYADIKPKRTAIMLPSKDYYTEIWRRLLAAHAQAPDEKQLLAELAAHHSSSYMFAMRYGGSSPVGASYANLDQLEANMLAAYGLTKAAAS